MRGTRETSPLNAELSVMITRWRHSVGWLVHKSCVGGEARRIIHEIMDLDSKNMRHFIEGMPKVVKNQICIFSYKYGTYYCHLLSFVYGVKLGTINN